MCIKNICNVNINIPFHFDEDSTMDGTSVSTVDVDNSLKDDFRLKERNKLSFKQQELNEDSRDQVPDLDSDAYLKFVPLRKSKASTDLTKDKSNRVNKLSLSSKKEKQGDDRIPSENSDKENSSPEIVPVPSNKKKKSVRISIIPHQLGDFADLPSKRKMQFQKLGQRSKERSFLDTIESIDIGDPVSESTRLHSRESIARYLPGGGCLADPRTGLVDPESRYSIDGVELGQPVQESTRIHSRESMVQYLPGRYIHV